MRKLTLYPQPIPTTTRAILYTFHDENDVMSISLQTQEKICKDYISTNDWILETNFSDSCPYANKVMDREGIKELMNYINKNEVKNYCLVLFSPRIFGSCLRSASHFIGILEKKEMNIFTVEDKVSAENGSGLFALQIGISSNIFFHKILNSSYVIFAANIKLNTYKGSFMDEYQLRKILRTCVDDNCVQIRRLSELEKYWEYRAETNVGSEVDKCIRSFYKYLANE